MKYPLACDTWDEKEVNAIQEVIKSGRYTMGSHVKKFEQEFCDFFKCQDAVMVNSGSTANLLILALLKEKYKLGGDIIVPAVSWSTTYYPVYQYGFKLNFVDVDKGSVLRYEIDDAAQAEIPHWLVLNSNEGMLSGNPGFEDYGNTSIDVFAVDDLGAVSSVLSFEMFIC